MTKIEGTLVKGLIKTLGMLCLCWPMHSALADSFEVGFYDYPPMMIEDGRRGIYQDILDALAELTGDRFNVQYYPYPRLGMLFNEGQLDIEPGVYPGWVQDQSKPGVFSVPFGKVVDVLGFGPHKAFAVMRAVGLRGGAAELDMSMAEMAGIHEDVRPKELVIMRCDAKLHRTDYAEEASDLNTIRAKGAPGGGGG